MTKMLQKAMGSSKTLIHFAFALLLILLASLCLQGHATFVRQESIYHATTVDFLNQRVASLAEDLQEVSLDVQSSLLSLVSVLGISTQTASEEQIYKTAIRGVVATHSEFYLVRYVPRVGTVYGSGAGVALPRAGQPGSPFTALLNQASSAPAPVVESGLERYTAPDGTKIPLVFLATPIMLDGTTAAIGHLEVAFDMRSWFTEVSQAERADEQTYLLDNEERYLVNQGDSDFATRSLADDYPPEVVDQVYGEAPVGSFSAGGKTFSYRHIEQTGVTYQPGGRQYWVLMTVADDTTLFSGASDIEYEFAASLALFTFFIVAIAFLVFILHRRMQSGRYS